jgi:hypothetical protein
VESAVLHELVDQHALVAVLAEAEEADKVLEVGILYKSHRLKFTIKNFNFQNVFLFFI